MPRKVGRPASPVPTIDWKCYIPLPIAAKVDLLLLDPVRGTTRYGMRSALVTQLLLQWLNERGAGIDLAAIPPVEAPTSTCNAATNPPQYVSHSEPTT